ncbi:MAG: OmpA family protein [Burkholderiales bacterium]
MPKPAPRVAAPPPPPPPVVAAIPLVVAPLVQRINLSGDTHFDFGKAELNAKGIAELERDFKGKLKGLQIESIIMTGYTDNVGAAEFNQTLSLRRAEAVKAFAISRGVDGSKIQTVGRGETNPIADNKTAQGRAANRRVEVEIKGTR